MKRLFIIDTLAVGKVGAQTWMPGLEEVRDRMAERQ